MRFSTTNKVISICVLTLAILSIFQSYKRLHNDWRFLKVLSDKNDGEMKYILQWTSPNNIPFVYMGKEQNGFISRNCQYTNCFVTSNKSLFDDYTKFDVIAFAGPEVVYLRDAWLPKHRSPHQKYVFASIESAQNYPVCSPRFEGYFNWTWTYKLDSEIRWGYIVIKNMNNQIIGPKKVMNWLDQKDMDPVSAEFRDSLRSKTKIAAWFVSNCFSKSGRGIYVANLQKELRKYDLNADIYGDCSALKCPRDKEDECNAMIAKDYYFYLSFENAFSEDYVTEKLLTALQNNVVPIVYGGANYSRFLPSGSYLNARELSVKNLAAKMFTLINDPYEYAQYFRWKNHYTYHRTSESVSTNEYCKICELLNNEELVKKTTVYRNFRDWWDPDKAC